MRIGGEGGKALCNGKSKFSRRWCQTSVCFQYWQHAVIVSSINKHLMKTIVTDLFSIFKKTGMNEPRYSCENIDSHQNKPFYFFIVQC